MTTVEQLERDLTAWFADTAVRETPEFAQDIVMHTSGIRQRARWTFLPPLSRPMARGVGTWASPVPRRALTILVVLGLVAVLAGSALFVASRPRQLAPYGRAANGLVAYSKDDDIFLVDPATGVRTPLVVGSTVDRQPRWSRDGTRLAFIRETGTGQRLVIVDADGRLQAISGPEFQNLDVDGIQWSPDGRQVLVRSAFPQVALVDAATGQTTALPIAPWGLEVHWRPPDGRELLFLGGLIQQPSLYRYALDGGAITEVPGTGRPPAGGMNELRPIGFTPDGSRFAYHRTAPTRSGYETAVVDVETGTEVVLEGGFGRISNDGTRIVSFTGDGTREWICVAPVAGGPCTRISGSAEIAVWSNWASFQWAPDDRWIWSYPEGIRAGLLLDPMGGGVESPSWAAEGVHSWQRRAP